MCGECMKHVPHLKTFKFWCQQVLPLVYDDSLSYYEVLCKVVDYLNHVIKDQNKLICNVEELEKDLRVVQAWIDDFDTGLIEQVINEYIATFVTFGLTDAGYFVAYIPKSWKTVQFRTTGYDIDLRIQEQAGHLVLLY